MITPHPYTQHEEMAPLDITSYQPLLLNTFVKLELTSSVQSTQYYILSFNMYLQSIKLHIQNYNTRIESTSTVYLTRQMQH